MSGTRAWFVYFKVPAAERDAYVARAHRLVAHVSRATGVAGRVMTRSDRGDGADPVTLMEVYDDVRDPAALLAALDAGLVAGDWPSDVRPARHVERFVTI